jgi:hypothetical protein
MSRRLRAGIVRLRRNKPPCSIGRLASVGGGRIVRAVVDPPMVRVATASGPFEAKLLAARLGADGILWELRGGADGIYPMGPIDVLVAADDADIARVLLLPDADFDAGAGTSPDDGHRRQAGRRLRPLLLIAVVVLSLIFVVARTFAL